jgi:preprotein translocase subunit SecD
MNRYPVWKYLLIVLALAFGATYALPNLFGDSPAIQVSSAKSTAKVDTALLNRVEGILKTANVTPTSMVFDNNSIKIRLKDTETQLKVQDAITKEIAPNPDEARYVVAQNLLSSSPSWLTSLGAVPMYLGLDLRGGLHFLMQVDMKQALVKRYDATAGDIRMLLREKNIRHSGINRGTNNIEVKFRDEATRKQAKDALNDTLAEMTLVDSVDGTDFKFTAVFKPEAITKIQENALKQNISTLNNRVNETGVSEPVIQQQGLDRIVIQLPGVQDVATTKKLIGRTPSLEVRMVCESPEEITAAQAGTVPFGCEKYADRDGPPILVRKAVVLTGDNLNDAQAGFDSQTQEPTVNLNLDSKGASIFKAVTRDNIGKRMAILLIEKGKGEVVTAPTIRSEIGGGRVQISGKMTSVEAAETALLLRSGALAAPMEIIEERTIGPSLGKENIAKGFYSTLYGFAAVAAFMTFYYMLFGVFSSIALAINVLLLVALLSVMQATLTLPGMAAIALTLGMAIDSNVLINERIREELRNGVTPQVAIATGYERAWATILDSNVTTLIAGLALLVFGSGAVRGFAVVHCLGILTSMFSAVFFSRALVNLWYGSKKKVSSLAIGTVWKPGAAKSTAVSA